MSASERAYVEKDPNGDVESKYRREPTVGDKLEEFIGYGL